MDGSNHSHSLISQDHLDLISRIYELPQHPERWPTVLDEFALLMNASLAATAVYDHKYDPHHLNAVSSSFGPSFLEAHDRQVSSSYKSAFAKMAANPKRAFLSELEMLGLDDHEQYAERPVVQWLKQNYGLFYGTASCLNLDRSWTDILLVMFPDNRGPVSDQERKVGNFFLDHFAKSVELGRAFGELKTRHKGTLSALDRIHIGILVLSPTGTVVLKNKEADRILEASDGIKLSREEQLYPIDGGQREKLKEAISQAVHTARAQHNRAETLLTLPRRSGAEPYLVEVAPFCDNEKIESLFKGCLVFIIDPTKTDVVSTDGMQAIYGLTGSESEVCKLVAEGFQTDEIADARNLTRETVRNYVKQVLQKTGTKNRSQLVRLALNVNLPIDPAPGEN